MIGAIIGDIAGSAFEFNNYKFKDFEIFGLDHRPTDDSLMTIAVAVAILRWKRQMEKGRETNLFTETVNAMRKLGREYPEFMSEYGHGFRAWLTSAEPAPYNSCGNGAAMRISPAGFAAKKHRGCKKTFLRDNAYYPQSPGRNKGGGGCCSLYCPCKAG